MQNGWMTSPSKPPYRLKLRDCLLYFGIPAYLLVSVLLFFSWVNPSLVGDNDQHIGADSGTYMSFAKSLRAGEDDPYVLASLYSFPNTFWGPVLIGLVLNGTVQIMIANYAILLFSLWLITRAAKVDLALLLLLMFANITTTISLLTLNKEILDLLANSLFIYYLARGKRVALIVALLLSAICRYETCAVMAVYLVLLSRWNMFRRSRGLVLVLICLALSIFLPAFLSGNMQYRLQEVNETASSGGLLIFLDGLQTHYLFFVATIPKILDNLFSELIRVSHWSIYSLEDPANTYFLLGNNLANLGLLAYLIMKRRFTLRSNLVYYACLSAIFMSTALVIQPRYLYGAYIMLCVEAARVRPERLASIPTRRLYAAV